MRVNIPEVFIEVIKNQALSSEDEIYGWLIGYQLDGEPYVLSIFECKKFEQQTLISAIPHAQEFQEISSVLPQGIGPIGIYHSHPASSEIFHSHADDSTLLSLSKQFPNSVSIVTNGTELNCYQMDEEDTTYNVNINLKTPKVPNFFPICMDEPLTIKIHEYYLESEHKDKLKIKIVNKFREILETIWDDLLFCYKGEEINQEKVSNFYADTLSEPPITIQFPAYNSFFQGDNGIKISPDHLDPTKRDGNSFKDFSVELKATIPVYVAESNKRFPEFISLIKTEIISNNLLQKLYNSRINFDTRTILLPEDVFINFFGFFIKIMLFKNSERAHKELGNKVYRFLLKLISQIQSIAELDLEDNNKNYIQNLINDIKNVAENYHLNEKIIQKLQIITLNQ